MPLPWTNDINEHIRNMGFTVNQYMAWCSQNKFIASLNKGTNQISREREQFSREKATMALVYSSKKISPRKTIEMIRNGYGIPQEEDNSLFKAREIYMQCFPYEGIDSELFLRVYEFLLTKSRIFENDRLIPGTKVRKALHIVAQIVLESKNWLQPYDSWKPKSYNPDRQLSGFLRHLFAKYPVPVFFDSLWTEMDDMYQREWFIHVGAGKNITTAEWFTNIYPMTKKMAHFFMQAPNDSTFLTAWRYGQIIALGGTARFVEVFNTTKMGRTGGALFGPQSVRDPTYVNFVLSVMKFFIANPMLDNAQVGPIVDYIWNQKYENQRIFVGRGQIEERGPAQSNFSMTGRTVDSLMSQVERWHRQLGKETKGGDMQWEHSRYNDFEWQEGSNESRNVKIWKITELLNSQELSAEGRVMHHCVASYAGSCFKGSSSIWSLSAEQHEGRFKYLTIEVDLRDKRIGQIRGPYNRMATPKEKQIISRWASREELSLSSGF